MMKSKRTTAVLLAALATVALPANAATRAAKPRIMGTEVGYFGGAVVTHQVSVFVYAKPGPRSGNRVTVCLGGVCERARGHNARTAWYTASFDTRALRMGDPVGYTVIASDSGGRAKITVTTDLLCMHNDGSTPQS